jgi:hypothetical protein
MDTVLQSDIFFFVTTIAVVIFTVGLLVAFVYIFRILKNLRDISTIVRTETYWLAEDIDNVRFKFQRDGFDVTDLFRFFKQIFNRKHRQQINSS